MLEDSPGNSYGTLDVFKDSLGKHNESSMHPCGDIRNHQRRAEDAARNFKEAFRDHKETERTHKETQGMLRELLRDPEGILKDT